MTKKVEKREQNQAVVGPVIVPALVVGEAPSWWTPQQIEQLRQANPDCRFKPDRERPEGRFERVLVYLIRGRRRA